MNLGLSHGTYDLELRNGGVSRPIDFDARVRVRDGRCWATSIWPAAPTELVLSDETSGRAVAADAVRFVRLDNGTSVGRAETGGARP